MPKVLFTSQSRGHEVLLSIIFFLWSRFFCGYFLWWSWDGYFGISLILDYFKTFENLCNSVLLYILLFYRYNERTATKNLIFECIQWIYYAFISVHGKKNVWFFWCFTSPIQKLTAFKSEKGNLFFDAFQRSAAWVSRNHKRLYYTKIQRSVKCNFKKYTFKSIKKKQSDMFTDFHRKFRN